MAKKRHNKFSHAIEHRKRFLDIIVNSAEIKKLIVSRAEELEISYERLAEEAKINYNSFKNLYLYKHEPMCSEALRQEHVIKMAELLGIHVRVTVFKTPLDEVDIKKLKNPKEYNESKRKRSEDPSIDDRY